MKMIPTARPLNPTELIVEGSTEARPCPGCQLRLVVPTTHLGQMVACPGCGAVERALPLEGPFGDDAPQLKIVPLQPATVAERITLGPVMPPRRIDPRDERSAMIDAVGQLQWASAAVILVVSVFTLARFWKQSYTAENEELFVYASVGIRVLLAGLMAASGVGVLARKWGGWGLALAMSAGVLAWVGWALVERMNQREGQAGWFDFTILAALPSMLVAIVTVVLLLTPRYLAEFRQAGTMYVPTNSS